MRATERGVTVRLLFDHLGSRGIPGYKECSARLDGTEIDWQPMLPIHAAARGSSGRPDLRNHRKILVVDGTVGLHGLAEPDRARLQQAEEPRGRAGSGSS